MWVSWSLKEEPAVVFEQVTQLPGETGGQRAVDHSMVVGQRDRQHEPGDELRSIPDGGHLGPHHTENGHLWCVDDRREAGAADAAQTRDGERAALHVTRGQLAIASFLGDVPELL